MGNQLPFRVLLFHYSRITLHCPALFFRQALAKNRHSGYNKAYAKDVSPKGKLFMFKKVLFPTWAVMFALCAGFGFVPEPTGVAKVNCTLLSLLFFAPPVAIVYFGWKEKDWESVRLVRNLAIGSLVLTLAMLVVNFMTVAVPLWVGDLVYAMLVIVSAPMVCSQTWILSLCLWAALMWTCVLLLGKKK
jgi:hypothetical protein